MTDTQHRNPFYAVSGLIVSMGLLAFGNGLMFAFVPLRLAELGRDPSAAGWMLTAMAAGGFLGCVITGPLTRYVGHARAFMTLAAMTVLTYAALATFEGMFAWATARMGYGLAVTGLFIVAQTWLNNATPNELRGRVVSVFNMFYVLNIGAGGFTIGLLPLDATSAPVLAIVLVALSIISAGVTSLPVPERSPPSPVSLRIVWQAAPVALAGALAVGGLTSLVQGYAPIYAQSQGYSAQQVGQLLLLMQLGMLVVQTPLGALSDRIDRRVVIVIACVLVLLAAGIARLWTGMPFWILVPIFGLWAGATETIFSVSNAHGNDRVSPENALTLTSTLMFAWSVSGFVFPGIAAALTASLGETAFMGVAMGIACALAAFIALRLLTREKVDDQTKNQHSTRTGQAPYMNELLSKSHRR